MELHDLYNTNDVQIKLIKGALSDFYRIFNDSLKDERIKKADHLLDLVQQRAFEAGYKAAVSLNISTDYPLSQLR